MKKNFFWLVGLLLIATVAFLGVPWLLRRNDGQEPSRAVAGSQYINYSGQVLRKSELSEVQTAIPEGMVPLAGITSHHLPTAENFIDEFYAQIYSVRPDIGVFMVVGPDHFERCKTLASTTAKDFFTPFGTLLNDGKITAALIQAGAGEDNSCFMEEHAIGVQASFIKKYFPDAKLVPVLFSSAAGAEAAEKLLNALMESGQDVFVISSTDFSHYEPLAVADRVDELTERQIKNLDAKSATLRQVDSVAALNFVLGFTKAQKAELSYFEHASSYDFTGNPDNTTSYFNVIFAK
ncbi:MAG: AmmeMemoRadiSam system protein B [Candidatus Doudnabacteria bacterium CG10_big_fil_rev_8_21_14_0_10_42_18]|uniref:AmmeMemoRadiSam system protein B n=1 Tax=Candidatus Doudnabacteria bacterium CG10_big_fil_rev_8_21_14_0_10_42_18 TaxID=1974552 RepID=A0A2H0V9Y5_9BACT|nr:MAG: AmmeMemoRadiSam system protein B [Candidatus Doudnabacteria bacterium CG10_big_fil_rev_8_21_14_0_10_42_18]